VTGTNGASGNGNERPTNNERLISMWQHQKFVKSRVACECRKYTKHGVSADLDDLEGMVWVRVVESIDMYEDEGTPLAWLRQVVFSVTNDHFSHAFAQKRDIRKEEPLPEAGSREAGGIDPSVGGFFPAVPSPNADELNGLHRKAKVAYDEKLGLEWGEK
jgi:hypothetical protein